MPRESPAASLIDRPVVVSFEPQEGQTGVFILNGHPMKTPPNNTVDNNINGILRLFLINL
jgi:hypothetical protein